MADKLLIVDDEQDVREFASNFFKKRKLDVLIAANGQEALEVVIREQPRLVLLDIKMEGMDGLEVLRRIRQLNRQIKVIMVTGKNDEETKQKAAELGANGYIHKPLELDELEKTVLKIWGKTVDV